MPHKFSTDSNYKRSVIVVEDDSFIRSLIAEYLEAANFMVTTAANAAEARRQIVAIDPDALVLDIDLGPGPTGIDIAQGLSLESNEVGIVFLTNYSDPRFAGIDPTSVHPNSA